MTVKEIVPLSKQAGYLEARRLTAENGMKLPSNVLHDDYLVRTNCWKEVKHIYPAWALEILVHPEKNGSFKKGQDVVDSETGWIVPAKYVPEEAVGRKGVGLLLVPGDIEEKGKVVIHPAGEPIILTPFIQVSGDGGKVDEATRVPLAISKELFEQLSEDEKRWLFKITGVAVRPIARGRALRRSVGGGCGPDVGLGVAGEAASGGAPKKLQVESAPLDKDIVTRGVTLDEFEALVRNANVSVSELSQTVEPEKLKAVRLLLQALEIKG